MTIHDTTPQRGNTFRKKDGDNERFVLIIAHDTDSDFNHSPGSIGWVEIDLANPSSSIFAWIEDWREEFAGFEFVSAREFADISANHPDCRYLELFSKAQNRLLNLS